MEFAADTLRTGAAYQLLTSVLVPRPIAWVRTTAEDGAGNLAPFSFVSGLCSDPPMLTVSIADGPGGAVKDTLRHLRATGCAVVHFAAWDALDAVHGSSAPVPGDEAALLGLPTAPCTAIPGSRLVGPAAALECRLVDTHRYGRASQVTLCVLEVVHVHLDDALRVPDKSPRLDSARADPLARLGAGTYARLGERARRAPARTLDPDPR